MRSALVLGLGQIGTQIARDLTAAGTDVRVMTRSRPPAEALAATAGAPGSITWAQGDASNSAVVRSAAEEANAEAIFACVHAAYDSRVWATTLPGLEAAIMDAAADLGIPVVFPESVYAFAGLDTPITADSPFSPVDDKGRIRRQLIDARAAHPARVASVLAGDLIGATATPTSSVVRLCITDRIAAGRRAVVLAHTDVSHGITVIGDMTRTMLDAAADLADSAAEVVAGQIDAVAEIADPGTAVASPTTTVAGPADQATIADTGRQRPATADAGRQRPATTGADTHRLVIAPSANPTLADIAAYTHEILGSHPRKSVAVPPRRRPGRGLVRPDDVRTRRTRPDLAPPLPHRGGHGRRLAPRDRRDAALRTPHLGEGRPQLCPRKIPLPGPSGRSKKYQIASRPAHASQNGMTNGNIREITVPRPAFGS